MTAMQTVQLALSQSIPLDLGPYGLLAAVIIAIGLMIVAVMNFLDKRAGWAARIEHLEDQVARLENGHAVAQGCIVEALAILPEALTEVASKLIAASKALA